MSAALEITTRQGVTFVSDTYVWVTPAGSPLVQHARLKWRAGNAPGATVLLTLSDGSGITLSSITTTGCTLNYTISAATLLAIAAGDFLYDLLVDYADGTTDCVIGSATVTHLQTMTQ